MDGMKLGRQDGEPMAESWELYRKSGQSTHALPPFHHLRPCANLVCILDVKGTLGHMVLSSLPLHGDAVWEGGGNFREWSLGKNELGWGG